MARRVLAWLGAARQGRAWQAKMKTIRQLQIKDDLDFLFNVVLHDFLVVVWVYLVIWLVSYIFL